MTGWAAVVVGFDSEPGPTLELPNCQIAKIAELPELPEVEDPVAGL